MRLLGAVVDRVHAKVAVDTWEDIGPAALTIAEQHGHTRPHEALGGNEFVQSSQRHDGVKHTLTPEQVRAKTNQILELRRVRSAKRSMSREQAAEEQHGDFGDGQVDRHRISPSPHHRTPGLTMS